MDYQKLSVENQISHMKSKGIQFNIINENDAMKFLNDNNYYFKLKAYAKNYEKYPSGKDIGKYIDLDFAYLVELSTIDMHIRRFIIRMTLDIEHILKPKLVRECANNHREDGKEFVKDFLDSNERIRHSIDLKKNTSYCSNLIYKYESAFAIWNIVEVLTFGDFIKLYEAYYRKYPSTWSYTDLLFSVKSLRNAAAHSNCIINTLKNPYTNTTKSSYSQGIEPNYRLTRFMGRIAGIGSSSKTVKLTNPVIHDFVAMLYLFYQISFSEKMKKNTYKDLQELLKTRIIRKKEYFSKNNHITSSYEFIRQIVDFLEEQSI